MASKGSAWLWIGAIVGGTALLMGRKAHAATPPSPIPQKPSPATAQAVAQQGGTAMLSQPESHLYGAPLALSANFDLSEFLRSTVMPEIAQYRLTADELANVKALCQLVLQPLRDKYGPIDVTSGGRPLSITTAAPRGVQNVNGTTVNVPAGSTIDDLLKAAGYAPAANSDHHGFSAADIKLTAPGLTQASYSQAYADLQANPHVRQVIMYTLANGLPGGHIHVSVISPDRPKESGTAYAFLKPEAGGVA